MSLRKMVPAASVYSIASRTWLPTGSATNFFMIVCPYLDQSDTIAYFALKKHTHCVHATGAIFNTTQVIIEAYRQESVGLSARPR